MNDPDLYLVRVWRGDTGFRASARRIDTEEPRMFASPLELARYLAEPRERTVPPACALPHHARGALTEPREQAQPPAAPASTPHARGA